MARRTVQRDAILRVLQGTRSHPTAEWVYLKAKEMVPDISLGTIYRNLNNLSRNGTILVITQAGAETRFDANPHNHYHLRCEICGGVSDVEEPVDTALDQRVQEKTGLAISHHVLEFRGRCLACVSSQETARNSGGPA